MNRVAVVELAFEGGLSYQPSPLVLTLFGISYFLKKKKDPGFRPINSLVMVRGTNKRETSCVDSGHEFNVSGASVTFQIPFEAGSASRILDEDNNNFLEGLDDSFGTPR